MARYKQNEITNFGVFEARCLYSAEKETFNNTSEQIASRSRHERNKSTHDTQYEFIPYMPSLDYAETGRLVHDATTVFVSRYRRNSRDNIAEISSNHNGCKQYLHTNLPTLKRVKPEHLFMLCAWNSGEGPSETGVHPRKFSKNYIANGAIRVILELYL